MRYIDEETRDTLLSAAHMTDIEDTIRRILDEVPVSNSIPLDGCVKVGDLTVGQLSTICAQFETCQGCPLIDVCDIEEFPIDSFKNVVDAEINFSKDETERAKKTLIECGIMTEDGEISEAYKDIIVKKEN